MSKNIGNSPTFYLFSRPSFAEGVARIFDLSGSLQEYNYSHSDKQADSKALENDWKAVGVDIKEAVRQYERQRGK